MIFDERLDVKSEKFEPLLLVVNLLHMNVSCGDGFVTALNAIVLQLNTQFFQPTKMHSRFSAGPFGTYRVNVSGEDGFLKRPHVLVEESEPLLLIADLVHVNVASRNILITAVQSRILFNDNPSTAKRKIHSSGS